MVGRHVLSDSGGLVEEGINELHGSWLALIGSVS